MNKPNQRNPRVPGQAGGNAKPRPRIALAPNNALNDNLKFYKNELSSKPAPGSKIEDMLKWKGDYKKLEEHKFYIQWLFPVPGSKGINEHAQPLQSHEAKAIRESDKLRDRVVRAFEMMLDFYGMKLTSRAQGTVERCDSNFEQRYQNLDRSEANYKRISRILVSLGHLGYERYQVPWVLFIIQEMEAFNSFHGVTDRTLTFWVNSVASESDRNILFEQLCERDQATKPVIDKTTGEGSVDGKREVVPVDEDDKCLALLHGSESLPEDPDVKIEYLHGDTHAHKQCSIQ